jgi:hypothetical protein
LIKVLYIFLFSVAGYEIYELNDEWTAPTAALLRKCKKNNRFYCPRQNCSRDYKHARSLQRHMNFECGGMRKFRCSFCSKGFSQITPAKRHSAVCPQRPMDPTCTEVTDDTHSIYKEEVQQIFKEEPEFFDVTIL